MTDKSSKPQWIPEQERIVSYAALLAAAAIILTGLWSMLHLSAAEWHARSFKGTFRSYGSNVRLVLFFVLSYYVLGVIVRRRSFAHLAVVTKWLVALMRLARRFHTPAAVIAISLIVLHAVGAFLYGFRFDFNNVTGLLALLALLPVPVSGLLRYRKLDRRWHLRCGIAFAVLVLIHAFL
jgi:lysylphosphatidylglycerol synthetase-like protein (DUF2156 family)